MNPAYSHKYPQREAQNPGTQGKSGFAPLSGVGAAISLSAGFAGAEPTCHQLPEASIRCKKPRRNWFVKGHRQSRFGSGFTAKAGNV